MLADNVMGATLNDTTARPAIEPSPCGAAAPGRPIATDGGDDLWERQ
jgi:hypothetical protein